MKKLLLVLLLLGLLAALAAGFAYQTVTEWLHEPMQAGSSEVIELTVARGDTVRDVAAEFANYPWFKYPRLWSAYAQREQLASKIQAGDYQIQSSLSPVEFLDKLVAGKVEYQQLRIIEGSTYKQMLEKVKGNEFIDQTIESWSDEKLSEALGLPPGSELEGWFYPDTMRFAPGVTDLELLRKGMQAMQAVLDEEWAERADNLPYETPYEALIMASIVEKETGRADEREKIAGVFVRRLRKKMRLQTDPTVIYGLGDEYSGNLRKRHLTSDTPYNTYTRKGLPPTPIALSGRAAVHAALHPADGDELFFVARGDGSHYFSATLAEHEKAVREYQINRRRKDYRSAP